MNKPLSYLERNALGYEGDTFIHWELQKLVQHFEIKIIIETGTFLGATTKRLAEFAEAVFTIENQKENFEKAVEANKHLNNIKYFLGGSQDMLQQVLEVNDEFKGNVNVLFFLDAHWYDYCPLLDELDIIAKHNNIRPVIVIHDFKVPGKPEFGFDSYKGQDFEFEWIQQHIEAIYNVDGYAYHYNEQADGAMRGVIYFYPKK